MGLYSFPEEKKKISRVGSSLRLLKKKKKKKKKKEQEEEEESLRLSKKKKKEQEEEFNGYSLRLSKKKRKKQQEEEEESLRLSKKEKKKEQEEEEQSKPCHHCGEVTERLVLEVRRAVREEFHNLLRIHGSPAFLTPRPPTKTQKVARFQLHFDNKLPSTLFTDREIKAEDGNPIRIVIRDINSREIVSSGPLSSLKIKIVVIDGEFCDDGQEWTEDEFLGHIKSERKGKRPLLTGGLDISLSNGVGYLRDAMFTDNSSWTKSGFRLGTVQCKGFSEDQRVREATSEAFKVKDCRVELNQKVHPPLLDGEVCHLRKIGRNGPFHKKLLAAQIKTVQDFLRLLTVDPDGLRELLGRGMSNKSWKTVVDHARGCSLDDKLYSYSIKEKDVILVFDSIFQLVGAKIDGLSPLLSCLTPSQKELVDNLKSFAYKNHKDIVEFHGTLNVPPIPGSNVSPLVINDSVSFDEFMRRHVEAEPNVTGNVYLNDRVSTLQVKQPNITGLQVDPIRPLHPVSSSQHQHIPQSNEGAANQYKEVSDGHGLHCAQQPESHIFDARSGVEPSLTLSLSEGLDRYNGQDRNCHNFKRPSPPPRCLQSADVSLAMSHHLQLSLQHQPIQQSNEHSANQNKEASDELDLHWDQQLEFFLPE